MHSEKTKKKTLSHPCAKQNTPSYGRFRLLNEHVCCWTMGGNHTYTGRAYKLHTERFLNQSAPPCRLKSNSMLVFENLTFKQIKNRNAIITHTLIYFNQYSL